MTRIRQMGQGVDRPRPWRVVTGCSRVSPGCARCSVDSAMNTYLKRYYKGRFDEVQFWKRVLVVPALRKTPMWYDASPMGDLFHPDVTDRQRLEIFEVMRNTEHHLYSVCTKYVRPMREFITKVLPKGWTDDLKHVMLGVSVESQDYAWRVKLLDCWPNTRYVEFAPLLGRIDDFQWALVDWAIVSCEFGSGARPTAEAWVWSVINGAESSGVPIHVKLLRRAGALRKNPVIGGRRFVNHPPVYEDWRLNRDIRRNQYE